MKSNPNFSLYCSSITHLILKTYPELKPIEDQIKALQLKRNVVRVHPTDATGSPYNLNVVCIPAGHCPGSVM